jgi:hypothetical protein
MENVSMEAILGVLAKFAILSSFPLAICAGVLAAVKFDRKSILPALLLLGASLYALVPAMPLFKFTPQVIGANLLVHIASGVFIGLTVMHGKAILAALGSIFSKKRSESGK